MEGELKNLYCNMNLEQSLFSSDYNSDHSILFVEGSPEEVNIKIANLLKVSSLAEYTSLRVRVNGRVVKEQNTCCFMTTIFASAVLVLPIFCVCTEWWRRKTLRQLEVGLPTYELISDLLKRNNFQECFLLLEDNFIDREKLQVLGEGLRCGVTNLMLVNSARNFNIVGNNSSNFAANVQHILREVKYAEIRWEKTVFTNLMAVSRI